MAIEIKDSLEEDYRNAIRELNKVSGILASILENIDKLKEYIGCNTSRDALYAFLDTDTILKIEKWWDEYNA